jgi:predicted nicotinamide N-methyase
MCLQLEHGLMDNLSVRGFVLENTLLAHVSLVPEILLHTAGDVAALWESMADATGNSEVPLPFWATPWAGGQAVARYILDRPWEVAGCRVLDLATGSGLCAIAAARSAASRVTAVDIDRVAREAVRLNAVANGVVVTIGDEDVLSIGPPQVDVILAGDVFYEPDMSDRVLDWLKQAHRRGVMVLVGDPMRPYFPVIEMTLLETYDVMTAVGLEERQKLVTGVYTFE